MPLNNFLEKIFYLFVNNVLFCIFAIQISYNANVGRMQVQKADIKNIIVEVARGSFFKKGYRGTSMRNISKEAGVTLSNIYNYFKNKDEILEMIVQPVLNEMEEMFDRHNDPNYATNHWVKIKDISELDDFKEQITFIITYQKELDLLLHKCSGSKYENIKEYLIDRYTESSRSYLQLMKEKYPQVNKEISDFFIHTISGWWIQILSEIVSHNLNKEEIFQFGKEYTTFGIGGWKQLMNL